MNFIDSDFYFSSDFVTITAEKLFFFTPDILTPIFEASSKYDEYINIINRLVAITYINHDFDVALVNKAPEADQARLRKIFYDEVGKRCKERPQRLLAGVVDRSLVYAFDKVAPEADHDAD